MLHGSRGRHSDSLLHAGAAGTIIYANGVGSASSSSSDPFPDPDPSGSSPSPVPYDPPPSPGPGTDNPSREGGYDVTLMCSWRFDQEPYGKPKAYINGKLVCETHATEHVIPYDVMKGCKIKGTKYQRVVTMSIRTESSGGPCVFTCTGPGCGASVTGYHFTVARFFFTMNRITGKCSLTVLE